MAHCTLKTLEPTISGGVRRRVWSDPLFRKSSFTWLASFLIPARRTGTGDKGLETETPTEAPRTLTRGGHRVVGVQLSQSSAPGRLRVSREAGASHVLIFIVSVSGLYSGQGSKWQRKGKCLASPPRSSAWAQHLLVLPSSPPPLWVLFPLPYGRKLVVDLRNTLLQFSPSGYLPCWTMRWLLVWSVGETFSISMILKTQPSSWSKLTGTAQHLGPNPTLWLTGQVWPWVSFLASLSLFSHL